MIFFTLYERFQLFRIFIKYYKFILKINNCTSDLIFQIVIYHSVNEQILPGSMKIIIQTNKESLIERTKEDLGIVLYIIDERYSFN